MIKKYRLISSEVEAVQWTGDNFDEIKEFGGDYVAMYNRCLFVNTPYDGDVCNVSDYILKNSKGNLLSMGEDLFKREYEEVSDGN